MSLAEADFNRNSSDKNFQAFDPLKRPQYDWKRKKKLSTRHPKYTMEWLVSSAKYFDSLNFLQKTLLILFWTKRNICHSFREISEDCGLIDRHAAMLLMKMLQGFGVLTINKQNYKGKHCGRNWYKLTTKGQKLIKLILNKAFRGTPVPVEALPIEIKKNYPVWIKQESKKSKVSKSSKNFFTHITKSSLRSDNKKNMLGQAAACGGSSFEEKGEVCRDWSILEVSPPNFESLFGNIFEKITPRFETPEYKRRKKLIEEYKDFKTCPRRKLFESLGFIKQYDAMHIGIWRVLEKEPIEKITKALQLMNKKLSKGKFRMKNFVGFFTHLMKKAEAMGYSSYKANIYRDAIDGKETPSTERLLSGHDSSEFVALAKEMEVKTGEKLPLKTLKWMFSKGDTHLLLKALQAVKFRMQLDGPMAKTRTENVYKKVKKTETWIAEEAMRDEKGNLLRDANGKVRWHKVEKTAETGFYEEILVGTREVPIYDHQKAPQDKIKSWVGLWIYAVKLGSVEEIHAKFFQKREDAPQPMPRLPGSPPRGESL